MKDVCGMMTLTIQYINEIPFCLYLCLFQSELELVQSHGIPPDGIIYSGVCKQVSHIKYAAKSGIDLLVCDNEAELRKISRCHPNAKYVLDKH